MTCPSKLSAERRCNRWEKTTCCPVVDKNGACPPTKNGQVRSVLELKKAKNRPKKRSISVQFGKNQQKNGVNPFTCKAN